MANQESLLLKDNQSEGGKLDPGPLLTCHYFIPGNEMIVNSFGQVKKNSFMYDKRIVTFLYGLC